MQGIVVIGPKSVLAPMGWDTYNKISPKSIVEVIILEAPKIGHIIYIHYFGAHF